MFQSCARKWFCASQKFHCREKKFQSNFSCCPIVVEHTTISWPQVQQYGWAMQYFFTAKVCVSRNLSLPSHCFKVSAEMNCHTAIADSTRAWVYARSVDTGQFFPRNVHYLAIYVVSKNHFNHQLFMLNSQIFPPCATAVEFFHWSVTINTSSNHFLFLIFIPIKFKGFV